MVNIVSFFQQAHHKQLKNSEVKCFLFLKVSKVYKWLQVYSLSYKLFNLIHWYCGKVGRVLREGNGTPLQYSCLENPMDGGAWTRLSDFTVTFHFHALEKEMATYSSVLAWRIPGTGEPGGLPSMGSHRVWHDWSDLAVAAGRVLLLFCFTDNETKGHRVSIYFPKSQKIRSWNQDIKPVLLTPHSVLILINLIPM